VHEIAHYAGVLEKGARPGGVIINLANHRIAERNVHGIVAECMRFVP
jgi:hypothetical protein